MTLYVLDTDIFSLYRTGHPVVHRHVLAHAPANLAISVISVEEQLSGWYTALRQTKKSDQLARVYQYLADSVRALGAWQILSFPVPAILRFEQLKRLKLNIGKMDLRIAAIVLENSAILVTRNKRDFQHIPGLVIEDWTV